MYVPFLTLLLGGCAWGADAVIHVAPRGNDQASGSTAQPVATLTKARDLVRAVGGSGHRIVVHGGVYEDVGLVLTAQDAGLTIEAAAGEHPLLYGGIRLRGWRPDGEGTFAAALPVRNDGFWEPRMLLVAGERRPRARLPAEGTFSHETRFDVPWMSSTAGGWQRKPTHEELTTLTYRAGDLGPWLEPRNAEVTVFHMWDDSCVGVTAHDVARRTLTLAPECSHPPGAFKVPKYVVWNIREGLTAPGQWYHDRVGGRIVYRPLPGQDLERIEVIVPTRASIIDLQGSAAAPVKEITLRGLSLSVTTVPLVAGGFAAAALPGAIRLGHTERCTLDQLTIQRVAGHGIDAVGGVGNRITASEVGWCGAGGMYVGGRQTTISENHVHDIGLSYPGAIGIYRGGTANTVSHNEVHGCSYSGINYGGTDNIIEANLVYDGMRTLHDGAAIYLFGAKHCIIRGNLVRDIVDTGGYGASGYYLDEQSEGTVIEGNVAVGVPWLSQNHMARGNILRNNVFIVTGDAKITLPKSTGYTLDRNIIEASGKIVIEGAEAVSTWSNNLFHSGSGTVEIYAMKDYRRNGPAAPAPPGTNVSDPGFVDQASGDYRFTTGSPAPALGIIPIDVRHAGRTRR